MNNFIGMDSTEKTCSLNLATYSHHRMRDQTTIIQEKIGQAIRDARLREFKSQEAFAREIGLHRTYLGSVERGERNISVLNLTKITNSLGMRLSELFRMASL